MNFLNTNPTNYQDYMGVSHWWVINSTLAYNFKHEIVGRLIVDNVFDRLPPFPALAVSGGNYNQAVGLYWSGIMGRYLMLAADKRF